MREEGEPSCTPWVAAPWLVLPTMVGRASRAKGGALGTTPGGSGEADCGKVMCWLSPQTQPLSTAWAEGWGTGGGPGTTSPMGSSAYSQRSRER